MAAGTTCDLRGFWSRGAAASAAVVGAGTTVMAANCDFHFEARSSSEAVPFEIDPPCPQKLEGSDTPEARIPQKLEGLDTPEARIPQKLEGRTPQKLEYPRS